MVYSTPTVVFFFKYHCVFEAFHNMHYLVIPFMVIMFSIDVFYQGSINGIFNIPTVVLF